MWEWRRSRMGLLMAADGDLGKQLGLDLLGLFEGGRCGRAGRSPNGSLMATVETSKADSPRALTSGVVRAARGSNPQPPDP
jgi:hypothetical protein